jgi:hypothetical protein
MYVCMYIFRHLRPACDFIHEFTCVCMYVCMYTFRHLRPTCDFIHEFTCVCMYVCVQSMSMLDDNCCSRCVRTCANIHFLFACVHS